MGERGFTLVEVLIVISIIAVLASLAVLGVQAAKARASMSATSVAVSTLSSALDRFEQDEGTIPGMELEPDPERNDFPVLFEALFGEKRPRGKGGRSAPYMVIKEEQIAVWDRDTDEYRKPTREERFDPEVPKYLLDAWGEPYIYRATKGKDFKQYQFLHHPKGDIYSKGNDQVDQTALAEEDAESDDIGNW